MEAVFIKLVNMSITASYLVIAVLALRLILKKAPKAIHCVLWALVALRLLCPVTFESSFSLVEAERTESAVDSIMDDYVGSYRVYWDITDEYQTALDAGIMPIHAEGGGSYVVTSTATPASEPTFLSDILAHVWLIGLAAMVLYAVISYLVVRRKVRVSIPVDRTIRLCDHIGSPFILGIIRPKIYLPSDLDPMTVSHVLAHEQAHLKRRDHWWKPLGFALLSIYWFNPVLWLAYILLCRDIEQACDEKVVKELDTDGKKAYSMALLQCSVPRRMIAACPLAFGEVGVKGRIKSVLNYKKPTFWIIIGAILACIAAAVCFLTDPKEENSAYLVTSDLWIYDVEEAEVTVWDENGAHNVYMTQPQIEEISEIIHDLEEDEFVKKKLSHHEVYIVLECKDFTIDLHWDGEYAGFTFDAETNKTVTGSKWAVKNEKLNAFLTEIAAAEYRLTPGTYAPVEADSINMVYPDALVLAQTYRYEVTEDSFIVHFLESGESITYTVDWCWEGYAEVWQDMPIAEIKDVSGLFGNIKPDMNDENLKYQLLYDKCFLVEQDGVLCLVTGVKNQETGSTDWSIYYLTEDHPYIAPPKTPYTCFSEAGSYLGYASVYVRSGDRRPGSYSMSDAEFETFCSILEEIPEDALCPDNSVGEFYMQVMLGRGSSNAVGFGSTIHYDGKTVALTWNPSGSDTAEIYQISYPPLEAFLENLFQPDRIQNYSIWLDDGYASYTHGDVTISLVKIVGWEYEIVPYTDKFSDFGIRCKPEWLDDWLFFGYMQGQLEPQSTFLHEAKVEAGRLGDEWHYLFENPVEETVSWREWPEPWKMIYRYADGGTYYIYNEGEFDERLAEHDRGGYQFIEDSFDFLLFAEEAEIIWRSEQRIEASEYENPQVSFDPETCSYNVLWHRKDSDGYAIVNVSSVWSTLVTEVSDSETE